MPDPQTPIIGLNIPTTGTDIGTWGLSLNTNFSAIDGLAGGITQISIVGGTVNLIPTQLPFATIQFIGALTSNATIVVPAYSGVLTFINSCTGAFSVIVTLSGQPKSVTLPPGVYVEMFFTATGPTTTSVPHGTVMLFAQATAPVGWTQLVGVNDAALRIVNGATGGTVTGTVGLSAFIAAGDNPVALSLAQIPAHTHGVTDPGHLHSYNAAIGSSIYTGGGSTFAVNNTFSNSTGSSFTGITIQSSGSGGTHAHGFPNLQYFDCLIASKI